jgi:hypothetical protein
MTDPANTTIRTDNNILRLMIDPFDPRHLPEAENKPIIAAMHLPRNRVDPRRLKVAM